MMGTRNLVWNVTKKLATIGLITFTVSDRYATVVPVRGASMSPTFNPKTNSFTGFLFFSATFLYNYKKKLIFTIGVLIINYMLQMIMSLLRNFALISSSFRTVISSSSGNNAVHFYAICALCIMTCLDKQLN